MPYTHLSADERETIATLSSVGFTQAAIGVELGRHKGTISRELRRNAQCGAAGVEYIGCQAQLLAQKRRRRAYGEHRKKLQGNLLRSVQKKLRLHWSPEQIAGRFQAESGKGKQPISHVTIYRWIRENKARGGSYYRFLRQAHRRRRKKYGSSYYNNFQVRGKVSIDDRPAIVERRCRMGDWEGDLVRGKQGHCFLVTLVERASGYLLMQRVTSKQSHIVRRAIERLMRKLPKRLRRTLTLDNGSEFSEFKKMESALDLDVYFAHPYASWERGTNENTNGLIRQYFPKQLDIRRVTRQELTTVTRRLNNRPRKRLNYQTPAQVLQP